MSANRCHPILVLLLVVFATVVHRRADCQDGESGDRNRPRDFAFIGVDAGCAQCHSTNGIQARVSPDDWVLKNEIDTWKSLDVHSQAYRILTTEGSMRIGRRLGIDQVHRAPQCLPCHSAMAVQSEPISTLVSDGIGCEGCHGPSGLNNQSGWGVEHWRTPDKTQWRLETSPQKKRSEFGYWNVRSIVEKSQICLSCHLGNKDEGKILTHEMYAAGHPILPAFELQTFIDQMPRHWRTLAEKSSPIRDAYISSVPTGFQDYQADALNRTQNVVIGSMIALSEQAYLLAACTGDGSDPPIAQFSCTSCHHELRFPGWRQGRQHRARGTPGRPVLAEWPRALVSLLLPSQELKDQLSDHLVELDTALSVRPFGVSEDVRQNATMLGEWLLKEARHLEKKSLNRNQGNQLLSELNRAGSEQIHDYDTARQIVWAYSVIHDEMSGTQRSFDPSSITASSQTTTQEVQLGWYDDAAVGSSDTAVKWLKEFEMFLQLDLRDRSRLVAAPDLKVWPAKTALGKIQAYDPAAYRDHFAKILELSENQSAP